MESLQDLVDVDGEGNSHEGGEDRGSDVCGLVAVRDEGVDFGHVDGVSRCCELVKNTVESGERKMRSMQKRWNEGKLGAEVLDEQDVVEGGMPTVYMPQCESLYLGVLWYSGIYASHAVISTFSPAQLIESSGASC